MRSVLLNRIYRSRDLSWPRRCYFVGVSVCLLVVLPFFSCLLALLWPYFPPPCCAARVSFFLSFFSSFNLFSTICICIDFPCGGIWRQGRRSTQVIVVVWFAYDKNSNWVRARRWKPLHDLVTSSCLPENEDDACRPDLSELFSGLCPQDVFIICSVGFFSPFLCFMLQ